VIMELAAAIAFLTRLPVATRVEFRAEDVARSARWFPLVGAQIGAFYVGGLRVFVLIFPPLVTAVLIVAMETLLTGALHLDGLADTADGFGSGRTRDDVLRIMRDHAIGSYGAVALILVIALKSAAIAALITRPRAWTYLILMPALGRWSAVLLSATQPNARRGDADAASGLGAVTDYVGRSELLIATVTAIALAAGLERWTGLVSCGLVAAVSAVWAWRCRRRIGGVTGDTLGAGIELSESLVLLFWLAWTPV
jgi:adenosylcobinamide-GDP ribazoletransferase